MNRDDGMIHYFSTWLAGKENRYESQGHPTHDDIAEMVVEVCIDPHEHKDKPSEQIAAISSSIIRPENRYTLPITEVSKAISMGCTVLPGICEGKRSPECWVSQQIWFIDIDNDEDQRRRGYHPLDFVLAARRAQAHGFAPAMMYETFSGCEDLSQPAREQRYRMAFVNDTAVKDPNEAQSFGQTLLDLFPEADQSSTQLNRLFFGTNKEVEVFNEWQF